MVLYPDGTQKNNLLKIRDGKLISREELGPSLIHIVADRGGLLLYQGDSSVTPGNEDNGHPKSLTAFSSDMQIRWQQTYPNELMFNGILPVSDGYVVYGYVDEQNASFKQYIAQLDTKGNMRWSHNALCKCALSGGRRSRRRINCCMWGGV